MLKLMATTTVMAFTLITTAQAAPMNIAPISLDPVVEKVGSRLTGAERLRRLMKPHLKWSNPITQSVRDATGDPNITVLDQRFGDPHQTYQCAYYYLKPGQRVLKCD